MSTYREHEDAVAAFLEEKKADDPEKFEEVCEKYPVQNAARQRVIRGRELTIGTFSGPSSISIQTAQRYDLETIYSMDEKG